MGIKRRFVMNNKGFTMIELLIVVAIFSLILTGLTIAFIQQQRLSNFTQEAIDVDQTGRTALDYIASIVRNAAARQGKTFSLGFENGGSTADPRCEDNTGDNAGSVNNILLGFRSRVILCNPVNPAPPDPPIVNCAATPNLCTECAVILRATIDGATKQATIADDVNQIIEQNFQDSDFADMTTFVNTFFLPVINTY